MKKVILNDDNKVLVKLTGESVPSTFILMFKNIKNKEYNFTTTDWNEMNNHISKCMYELGIF